MTFPSDGRRTNHVSFGPIYVQSIHPIHFLFEIVECISQTLFAAYSSWLYVKCYGCFALVHSMFYCNVWKVLIWLEYTEWMQTCRVTRMEKGNSNAWWKKVIITFFYFQGANSSLIDFCQAGQLLLDLDKYRGKWWQPNVHTSGMHPNSLWHVSTHVNPQIQANTDTKTQINIQTYRQTNSHTHTYTRTHGHTNTHKHGAWQKHTREHANTWTLWHSHARRDKQMHTDTHKHAHMNIHKHKNTSTHTYTAHT